MILDPKIFDLKSNTKGRKATVKWMPNRKSLVIQVAEQSWEGMDPLRWTAEIGLGELINDLRLTKEDVVAAVEIDIALGNKVVDYEAGWFKRERDPNTPPGCKKKTKWLAPEDVDDEGSGDREGGTPD